MLLWCQSVLSANISWNWQQQGGRTWKSKQTILQPGRGMFQVVPAFVSTVFGFDRWRKSTGKWCHHGGYSDTQFSLTEAYFSVQFTRSYSCVGKRHNDRKSFDVYWSIAIRLRFHTSRNDFPPADSTKNSSYRWWYTNIFCTSNSNSRRSMRSKCCLLSR